MPRSTCQRLVPNVGNRGCQTTVDLGSVLDTQARGLSHDDHRPPLTDLPALECAHRLGHLAHESLRNSHVLVGQRRRTPSSQRQVGANTAGVLTQRLAIDHRSGSQSSLRGSSGTLHSLQCGYRRYALSLGQTLRMHVREKGHDGADPSLRPCENWCPPTPPIVHPFDDIRRSYPQPIALQHRPFDSKHELPERVMSSSP